MGQQRISIEDAGGHGFSIDGDDNHGFSIYGDDDSDLIISFQFFGL